MIHDDAGTDAPPDHVVIVGCGRVGAGLASRLLDHGNSVAVVDIDQRAFRRLDNLAVERIEGVGYDRDTLIRAGVERATALAAVTNGDNSNIVVARTAREHFGVGRVFARIYDPRRAAIYERVGIPTIPSASLTIDMSLRQLLPSEDDIVWVDPSAEIALIEVIAPDDVIGERVVDHEAASGRRVVAVRRLGKAIIPDAGLVIQQADVLTVAVARHATGGEVPS
jgi:trk system potassium uptake protein TrkA